MSTVKTKKTNKEKEKELIINELNIIRNLPLEYSCNMIERNSVLRIAKNLHLNALVNFMEKDEEGYVKLILFGKI